MSSPSVSIVVPVYNQAGFLRQTLQSILDQDYASIECIVVNDGSTDGSYEVATSFGERVRVISQPNSGQSAALNKGFGLAQGDFVGYLSSDDLLDSCAVSRLMACALQQPEALRSRLVVFPKYRTIDAAGTTLKEQEASFDGPTAMLEDFRCTIGPGALVAKGLLQRYGGWNPEFRQIPDYEFWVRLSATAQFVQVPQVLASFRVHGGSQTFARSVPSKADESLRLIASIGQLTNLPAGAKPDRFISSAYLYSACLHFRSGRVAAGLNRLAGAFRHSPVWSCRREHLSRVGASILFCLRSSLRS